MPGSWSVLLLAGSPVHTPELTVTLRAVRAAGAMVRLVTLRRLEPPLPSVDSIAVHELVTAAESHGPAFRRDLRTTTEPAERLWLHVREDNHTRRWAEEADLVTWLDPRARRAARLLAEQHPRLRAIGPLEFVVETVTAGPPSRHDDEGGERPASPFARLRRLLSGGGENVQDASHTPVHEVIARVQAGDVKRAEEMTHVLVSSLTDPRERADRLGDVTSWCLANGVATRLVAETYAAELAVADMHYAAGEIPGAAGCVAEAIRTAFHPAVHFETLRSPLADDPAQFTVPWRTSRAVAALREAVQERRADPGGPPGPVISEQESGRRTRLLIATQHNADFLGEIREHFTEHPDFGTRFAMFKDSPAVKRYAKSPARYVEDVLANKPGLTESLERTFRANLEGVNVLFVEWCGALAALVSQMDTGDTRVVVRLHSFEVFTGWPQITNFGGIDDVVFVSEHLRDLAVAAIPGLRGSRAPRLHVIANAMELGRFPRPKAAETRFTLGVVGASKMVKDPRWAIEVLSHLRRTDDRYRLLLLRGNLQEETAAAREYAAALRREIAELPAGAVTVLGHTDDVPAALEQVGVVVSSSLRESFHMGLVEGVASGALPVVRDWPFFPGAARSLFPDAWVVDSPEAAAERILALTQDEQRWREETSTAADWVMERWDWPVVRREFERLFSG